MASPQVRAGGADRAVPDAPQELERMRRDAELLITTVARTGRAVATPADQHAAPAPAAAAPAAARSVPEPVHVGAHGAKGRKLSAEEELAALAGQVERPSSSPEGLFAKVAQMAAAADVAVPAPAPTPVARDDRPKDPPVRSAALRVPRSVRLLDEHTSCTLLGPCCAAWGGPLCSRLLNDAPP